MNLIFITRKVDRHDSRTGFVFSWIEKLAAKTQTLYVICQEEGDISGLPSNVKIESFGKEKGYGKMTQAVTLFKLCWLFAKRANGFFVHMHPIYAIMAWLPAKLNGKKIVLWYTHKSVDLKLRVAHLLVDEILTASKESFRIPSKKVTIVGHGIDVEKFQTPIRSDLAHDGRFHIISVGRISPVKDYETLIKAVEILVNKKNVKDIKVQIYGDVGLPKHRSYLDNLVKFTQNAGLDDYIDFQNAVAHEFVPGLLAESDVLVNLSETGSLDKNVLEAAATGILVLSSNEAFIAALQKISPDLVFKRNAPQDLADRILTLKSWEREKRHDLGKRLQTWVRQEHNLENLAGKIVDRFK